MADSVEVAVAVAKLETKVDNLTVQIELLRGDVREWHERYAESYLTLKDRVDHLEFQLRIARWAGGVVSAVVVALTIALLKQWLGV